MHKEIIILGMILSMFYYEFTQLSPAGIIVPGYIFLYMQSPRSIAYTMINALLTFSIAKLIGNFVILYGKRRFSIFIILSFVIDYLLGALGLLPSNIEIIGFLIPGIIALDFEKQGIFNTMVSLGIVVSILSMTIMVFRPLF